MDIERKQQLSKIITLSREMLALAEENAWEQVAELDSQRRSLVLQCFQAPTQKQDSAAVAAVIREVLSLNQQVSEMGKAFRQQLGNEIHTNQVGRTARLAYRDCAR